MMNYKSYIYIMWSAHIDIGQFVFLLDLISPGLGQAGSSMCSLYHKFV